MILTLAQLASLFTVPWLAGAGAVAVSIPVAIHLLSRLRRRRQVWGAMRFLTQAYRKHKQRLRFEQWLLLLVRSLLVLVVGLALAGPVISGAGWWGRSDVGRSIYLVMDNSLSSQTTDAQGSDRWALLIDSAQAILEGLGSRDQVWIFHPSRSHASDGPYPPDQAVEALGALKPGYSFGALGDQLDAAARQIKQDRVALDQAMVVVLSDWSRSLPELAGPMPESLQGLGQVARVLTLEPAVPSGNVQIQSLASRRALVVAQDPTAVTLPIQMKLRRFGDLSDATGSPMEVAVLDAEGRMLASATRRPRWAVGQSVASVNLDLPVFFANPSEGRTLILQAQLQNPDALMADNTRYAIVHVRHHLRVGLMDEVDSHDGFRARRWLELALQPAGPGVGVFGSSSGVRHLSPTEAISSRTTDLDAIFLLRPDLVPRAHWLGLADFVSQGGLLWVVTPSQERAALWAGDLTQAMGVDWSVGMEVVEAGDSQARWKLDLDALVPEALGVLRADWKDLLGPVEVRRRLPISASDSAAWLKVQSDQPDDALLVATRVGQGSLLLLGTDLETHGSNLMAKPLFVPLVHETLRALMGNKPGQTRGGVANDPIALGPAWDQVVELERIVAPGIRDDGATRVVALEVGAKDTWFDDPGVYGSLEALGLRLAVNVEADAGETLTADRNVLAHWLDGLGTWAYLDRDDLQASLAQVSDKIALGWLLLWVALVLALLETWLARVMSFAHAAERRTWTWRIANTVRHLRHDEPLPGPGSRPASGHGPSHHGGPGT